MRDLKQTMKMDVLRCKSVDGVLKELIVYGIVYNLVRLVMGRAANRQRVAVDRISFIDALRWLLEAKPGRANAEAPGQPVASGPVRASREEAEIERVPGDEEAPPRAAQRVVVPRRCGIVLTPFVQSPLFPVKQTRSNTWRYAPDLRTPRATF